MIRTLLVFMVIDAFKVGEAHDVRKRMTRNRTKDGTYTRNEADISRHDRKQQREHFIGVN